MFCFCVFDISLFWSYQNFYSLYSLSPKHFAVRSDARVNMSTDSYRYHCAYWPHVKIYLRMVNDTVAE